MTRGPIAAFLALVLALTACTTTIDVEATTTTTRSTGSRTEESAYQTFLDFMGEQEGLDRENVRLVTPQADFLDGVYSLCEDLDTQSVDDYMSRLSPQSELHQSLIDAGWTEDEIATLVSLITGTMHGAADLCPRHTAAIHAYFDE